MSISSIDVEAVLSSAKALPQKDLDRLRERQDEERSALGALVDLKLVSAKVAKALNGAGIRVFDFKHEDPDPAAAAVLDGEVARRLHCLPVAWDGDRLVVALMDPDDSDVLDEVAAVTGLVVEPALAFGPLDQALVEVYGLQTNGDASRAGLVDGSAEAPDLHDLLEQVLEQGASDLHLTAGRPPVLRVDGDLVDIEGYPPLVSDGLQQLVYGMLAQKQREAFEEHLELDTSYALPGKARFRVNVYQQRGSLGVAFRLVPYEILSVEDLGLPVLIEDFARLPRGLVVVTGPTGSGKSTTLAAIVDAVNRERAVHIMTVEDPIEFIHPHRKSLVNQREVGEDTFGFAQALKHVLRQDPDVILVGELRDLETIQMAVTAAETGHLVFATLHTQDAPQTVDRIIDVFPPHQQQQIRVQLASTLQGVVAQQLLPRAEGSGRAAACEVLIATPAVRNLIREGKTHQIYSSMQAGGKYGMQTMDAALSHLVATGMVDRDLARERSHNPEEFTRLAGGRKV